MKQDFSESVNQWCDTLSDQIEIQIHAGKRVFLIALSRKMPRFFNWLRNNQVSDSVKRLMSNIFNNTNGAFVYLTTEYAIPMIFANIPDAEKSQCTGIVVDDAVIFGTTANNVCKEWHAASGVAPFYSALCRSESGVINSIPFSKDLCKSPKLTFKELKYPLREISRRILETSLPVDMEYPIFKVDVNYDEVRNHIQSSIPQSWCTYSVESVLDDVKKRSFTILFGKDQMQNCNNDFAKVRVFDKDGSITIEVLAPCSISVNDLTNKDFFTDEKSMYRNAWAPVVDAVSTVGLSSDLQDSPLAYSLKGNLEARKTRTLIVWANYLISLSLFIENIKYFVTEGIEPRIRKEDIELILGLGVSDNIITTLNSIIKERLTIKVSMMRVALATSVNPSELTDNYIYLLKRSLKPENSLQKNLDEIYKISYFSSELYDDMQQKDDIGHHVTGESFESLRLKLRNYSLKNLASNIDIDTYIDEEVNKWIDKRIDESRISPKYETVTGSDGQSYFRRFFYCGSNNLD